MTEIIERLAPLIAGLLVALVVTPLAIRLARGIGATAEPTDDRWHRRETPLLGGVGVTAGIIAALLLAGGTTPQVLAVAGGALLLFTVGLIDDLKGLRPATKIVAQTAAAGVLLLGGVRAGWPEIPLLSIPLTMLWVVGLSNAFNLLDNMDGLAAGVAAICALSVAACAAVLEPAAGSMAVVVALAVAGGSLGFLPFNTSPARVFMGDAGSLPLGFTLAAASLLATHREAGQVVMVVAAPLLALAVPILDTTLVSVVRKWNGRSIAQGGRDHLSHRLVALGMPERRAVQVLWGAATIFGVVAVAATRLDLLGTAMLLILGVLASIVLGAVLGRVKVYAPTDRPAEAARTEELRQTFVNYGRVGGPLAADFVLVGAAYVCAYLLRYEGTIPPQDLELLEASLPVVVAVQLGALAACRVYRSVWRFFGIRDAISLVCGVGVAAVLATVAIVFLWRESVFSRAVLILDAVLLIVFLSGARLLTRVVADAFGGFRDDGARVLVIGAGQAGTLCLRALRARGDRVVTPIGILDDDPALRRRHIHGVPVLGGTDQLQRLIAELEPEEVVLSSLPADDELQVLRDAVQGTDARLTLSPYATAFVPLS